MEKKEYRYGEEKDLCKTDYLGWSIFNSDCHPTSSTFYINLSRSQSIATNFYNLLQSIEFHNLYQLLPITTSCKP